MKRREFVAGLGGAAAWAATASAQGSPLPVIGYLGAGTLEAAREAVTGLHGGLSETGYAEGRNLAVEYRWAEDRFDRLPALASEFVRQQVSVIVAMQSTGSVLAAKAATRTIPIVFQMGTDPVDSGIVASLNRPGGNITGIYNLIAAVAAKRLELLHELVPSASLLAYLVNPTNPVFAEAETGELKAGARLLGLRLLVLNAADQNEIEAGFAILLREGAGGLVMGGDRFFANHLSQVIALATRNAVPTIYASDNFAANGGLMSYGTDFADTYRQVGIYAGRILKGEKPADLPVQQVTKMQLVINMKTAKALGLAIPESILLCANQVIE